MIQATARILQNVIEMRVGPEVWMCTPVVTGTGSISRKIAALFSTVYETHRGPTPNGEVRSTVSYHPKKDEIIIQVGERKWRTKSSIFGPMTLEHDGVQYTIFEKLTGRFGLLRAGALVASGELGFRSCVIRDYPPELEGILADLALGYLIRTLVWEMFR